MNTKNLFASLFAVVALVSSASAAFDLGTPASSTPYEPYCGPVKQVLNSLPGQKADMAKVQTLLKTGYGFRYAFTTPYLPAAPEVTAKTKSGDCKAKSLWLINQLGDRNVRYIIGKARSTSKINHAWVMWNDGAKWWILDPTNVSRPIAADSVSSSEYIPLFSYSAGHAYRHGASSLASVASGNAAVAAR
jgi:transglutaminase-like putative cysteine protease